MLLQVLCFWYPCLLTGKACACLNQSPCRLSLGVLVGLCVSDYAVNTYLYKSIQLLWLGKLTSVACCYLAFRLADGQEFSVSQSVLGSMEKSSTFETRTNHKRSTERGIWSASICWICGNCRNAHSVASPPIRCRLLSLQVTSCHCWQCCTGIFLLRCAVIANGIHVFAIPKASSMRHKLTAVFQSQQPCAFSPL